MAAVVVYCLPSISALLAAASLRERGHPVWPLLQWTGHTRLPNGDYSQLDSVFRPTVAAANATEFMRHNVTDALGRWLHYCFRKQDANLTHRQTADGIHQSNSAKT